MESIEVWINKTRYTMDIWFGEYGNSEHIFMKTNQRSVREIIIKGMHKRVWHGGKPSEWPNDKMYYSAPYNHRNKWHLAYFTRKDPYQQYRTPLEHFPLNPRFSKLENKILSPFAHQQAMADHWFTRKQCHLAAEMRTGKTLPALSIIEYLGRPTWIIAPRSAIAGIQLEIYNWGFPNFHIMTYDRLKTVVSNWTPESPPPQVVLFDEFSKAKNSNTQTTKACQHLTDSMRDAYSDPYILGMSGTPAPDNPVDWWSQIEIIQPGYILENHPSQLRDRLAIVEKKESDTGGFYPHIVGWLDDERKCAICGEEEHPPFEHGFTPSKNEVHAFSCRLEGMTKVFFKKDMNLPEKIFERRRLHIDPAANKYAKTIRKATTNGAIALNRIRQISSGFLYNIVAGDGEEVCAKCDGSGIQNRNTGIDQPKRLTECLDCNGSGFIRSKERVTTRIVCPKDAAYEEILSEHEEHGRLVAYGSFKGCIDRMVELSKGWQIIRVDGRGWHYFGCSFTSDYEALAYFKSGKGKCVFIAHPASGGMGISLSSSPTIVFWDNSFNGADRMQAVERGTDAGMDMNKGCRIIDLIHLPVDELVLDKLEKKQNLQLITMGEIDSVLAKER